MKKSKGNPDVKVPVFQACGCPEWIYPDEICTGLLQTIHNESCRLCQEEAAIVQSGISLEDWHAMDDDEALCCLENATGMSFHRYPTDDGARELASEIKAPILPLINNPAPLLGEIKTLMNDPNPNLETSLGALLKRVAVERIDRESDVPTMVQEKQGILTSEEAAALTGIGEIKGWEDHPVSWAERDLLQSTQNAIDIGNLFSLPEPDGFLLSDDADDLVRADVERTKTVRGIADRSAMPNGECRIENAEDLRTAIRAYQSGNFLSESYGRADFQRHIIKRARILGLTSMLPQEWGVNQEMHVGPLEIPA